MLNLNYFVVGYKLSSIVYELQAALGFFHPLCVYNRIGNSVLNI